MGKSRLLPFVVEVVVDRGRWTPSEWRMKQTEMMSRLGIPADGKATVDNLKAYCLGYENATKPGGVNAHIGVTRILSAKIINQKTGETLCSYTREPVPMFEVM